MSSPIHDHLKSAYDIAKSVGQMEGRQEMKDRVLEILRRTKHHGPNHAAMLLEIEKLDIRESGKSESK